MLYVLALALMLMAVGCLCFGLSCLFELHDLSSVGFSLTVIGASLVLICLAIAVSIKAFTGA